MWGDSFWIREQEVPDYWWDGTQALEQEGPKVDLSPYYTKDEINNIVNDINQKIEDKSTSIIFDTYIQMKSLWMIQLTPISLRKVLSC